MRLDEIELKDQRALTLLIDIARLLEASDSARSHSLAHTNARAAIGNAVLLLECIANSCLLSLALPGRLVDELDKLPTLSKLDYFMFAIAGTHIDRGTREVQLVAEVLKLRDHIVHPKPKGGLLVPNSDAADADYGSTKALNVPFDTRQWSLSVALPIVKTVTDFTRTFLGIECGLEKGLITTILTVREKALVQGGVSSWVTIPGEDLTLITKWLPSVLAFLDLREFVI